MLDLTTSTPDALCPPLEEARVAVKARVGEVAGDYHAEFELVRATDGRQALELILREGRAEVLRRQLPLDAAGCQDAAQAIALVLERYFDAVERPVDHGPAPKLETVPESPKPASPNVRPKDEVVPHRQPASSRQLSAYFGGVYDHELGVGAALGGVLYPTGWRLGSSLRVGLGVELVPFLTQQVETVREQRLAALSLQAAAFVPLTWSPQGWSFSFGPWAQSRLQRAEGATLQHEQAGFRTLPGLGGLARIGFTPAPGWALLAGLAAGWQIRGAAASFVLKKETGQTEVLVPDSWFGQGQLALSFAL